MMDVLTLRLISETLNFGAVYVYLKNNMFFYIFKLFIILCCSVICINMYQFYINEYS